ncbi:bifunctional adenosylcobinamide kinase/adenosylcobinamide-phosphate guanylyltransferase [Desulfuribacillus alkaliarsenatis]|uniref:Adenosylcobinamide kinase n=1 Tax=Desulfuribacillus alkaliarsenatis TaxID=766136 RepID=A0A1E5G4P8_9FIRM|nr:bifunctional adenosylcobinamide kinase/adenosylcobinamide-phosphate guanylyltransferase [Desulfuribacillus alkaliarsenatis]OEF97990.1 hypothetical protein BHF68_13060 [Desulfuribacillus alkaliarsenatis]
MAKLVMVVGGSRSGKSSFAEKLAFDYEKANENTSENTTVYYIATGKIFDEEFAKRVKQHTVRRPKHWITIEEPIFISEVLQGEGAPKHRIQSEGTPLYLIDGVGTWVANLMYQSELQPELVTGVFHWDEGIEQRCINEIERFIDGCANASGTIILVADEVGMDVVPEHKEARVFRDLNGLANQKLAKQADEVHLVVCGIPVQIK